MKIIDIPPAFINVLVIITKCDDGSGNAGDGLYQVTTIPDVIDVKRPNTILNFQLIPPTADTMVFAGMERKPSQGVHQLSNASISMDGKMLTCSDSNSDKETVGVTLLFNNGAANILHDPQVQNTPEN